MYLQSKHATGKDVYVCVCVYVCMYVERERESARARARQRETVTVTVTRQRQRQHKQYKRSPKECLVPIYCTYMLYIGTIHSLCVPSFCYVCYKHTPLSPLHSFCVPSYCCICYKHKQPYHHFTLSVSPHTAAYDTDTNTPITTTPRHGR